MVLGGAMSELGAPMMAFGRGFAELGGGMRERGVIEREAKGWAAVGQTRTLTIAPESGLLSHIMAGLLSC